jgi:hypothetical protein
MTIGMRSRAPLFLLVMTACALCWPDGAHSRGEAKRIFFRAERPAISVTMTKEGRYLRNVRVEADGRCTDGRRVGLGFGVIGSGRIELTRGGRFNMSRRNAHELLVFKGRVKDHQVRGYYRRFSDSSNLKKELRCGTGEPNSRRIYFVAHS